MVVLLISVCPQWAEGLTRADKAEWADAPATGLSACGSGVMCRAGCGTLRAGRIALQRLWDADPAASIRL